ncbi:MAG: hypothetical protein ABI183_05110 [Polyangiaceae bacterium]
MPARYKKPLLGEAEDLWMAALTTAGFQTYEASKSANPVPLASTADLTDRMRSVAVLLAEVPGLNLCKLPIYLRAWMRRQWLGIEPRGLLFDLVDDGAGKRIPLIDHYLTMAEDDEKRAFAWLKTLPLTQRLPIMGELMLIGDCQNYGLGMEMWALSRKLRDEGEAWAPGFADRLAGFFEDPRDKEVYTAHGPCARGDFAITVLLALVRAGIALEPRWDVLFQMWNISEVHLGALHEILKALPAERRPLAVRRIAEALDTNRISIWAPLLLAKYPFADATQYVLSKLSYVSKPRDFLKQLHAIAAKSPEMAAALDPGKQPAIPKLALAGIVDIRQLSQLDKVAQKQLVEANRRYGGSVMTAEAIFRNTGEDEPEGDAPQIETRDLERGQVVDAAGKHLYDFFFYNSDSGTFFAKGSTTAVADVVQLGVESQDKTLALALSQAMHDVSKPASKKSVFKKSSKKAVPKKSAPKKSSAKKGAARKSPPVRGKSRK